MIVLAVLTGVLLWFLASVDGHTRHVKNGNLRFFLMAAMPSGFALYMIFGPESRNEPEAVPAPRATVRRR